MVAEGVSITRVGPRKAASASQQVSGHFSERQWAEKNTHHSDGVVEETFAKDHDVERLVDGHVLEHAQHGHGVHRRDDAGKQQVLLQVDVLHAEGLNLTDGEEGHADADAVPQRAHHSEPQHLQSRRRCHTRVCLAEKEFRCKEEGGGGGSVTDRADILEERPGGHKVARVQDDGGQHVKEEDTAGEHSGGLLMDGVHDASHNQPDTDEETSFWHPDGDLVVHMEPWEKRCGLGWIRTV